MQNLKINITPFANEHYLAPDGHKMAICPRGSGCPICYYFRTLGANVPKMEIPTDYSIIPNPESPDTPIPEDIVPNDFSRIVERMGGDPPPRITEDECIRELSSLSDREYLCGAYWMFKQIFKVDHPILAELSLAKDREDMARILREHGL
jgi:hypothetical protein